MTRNFLALGSGEAAARIVAFAATVYIARVLGSEAFGIIGFALAVILYLNRIADAGLELGLGVQLIAEDPDRIESIAPSLLTARVLLAALLAAGLAVLGLVVFPGAEGSVLALYGLTLLAVGAGSRWILFGLERTRFVAGARTAGELVMVGLVFWLVRTPEDLKAVPLAQFAGDALAALAFLWWLGRLGHRLRPRLDAAAIRPLLRRAAPLVGSALLGLMIYNSDLIFLRAFRGLRAVGLYAAAYALISFLSNLGTAYSMSLLPTLTRLGGEPRDRLDLYRTATVHVFAAGFPIAVGTTVLAPGIIRLVFGDGYAGSALPLQILIWSVTLALLRDVPVVALMSEGREDRVLRLTAWATAANLTLNVAVIPAFGLVGAAAATVATEGTRMALARRDATRLGFTAPGAGRLAPPAIAGLVMGGALVLGPAAPVWLAVPAGVVVYALGLLALGGVRVRRGGRPSLEL
ncbi:MAG: oligosaccharide flippase family protein [Gemmatimonadota bacterium]